MTKAILFALVIANVLVIVGVARADGAAPGPSGTVLVCDGSMTHCSARPITASPTHAPKGALTGAR